MWQVSVTGVCVSRVWLEVVVWKADGADSVADQGFERRFFSHKFRATVHARDEPREPSYMKLDV